MSKPKYFYELYVETSPEKLWAAITSNEFWQKFSGPVECDWQAGSPLKLFLADGTLYSQGEVLESSPPQVLSHTWPDPEREQTQDAPQRMTWKIESAGSKTVKLTITHEELTEKAFRGVSGGWPVILSSLKSQLETGAALPIHPTKELPSAGDGPQFVYVTVIKTTPDKLWHALISAEFSAQYWCGIRFDTDWKVGSRYTMRGEDGTPYDVGEILEFDPPCRLSYTFSPQHHEQMRAEPPSRVTFELEPLGDEVKLTILHDRFPPGSLVYEAIQEGWPSILCSLKTLLETGRALEITDPSLLKQAIEDSKTKFETRTGEV